MLTKDVILADNPYMSDTLAESIMKAYKACKSMQNKRTEYPSDIRPRTEYLANTLCDQLKINTTVERIKIARIIQKNNCSERAISRALHIGKKITEKQSMDKDQAFGTICGILKTA